jgi:Holliday junction DNA helicase RuvA
MIGFLHGIIKICTDHYIIIDCNGVGYRVELGEKVLSQTVGSEKEFYIYTHVRENELKLFGFETQQELELFEMLLEVNGVGPKSALTLITHLGVQSIIRAILEKNSQGLKVSGIGAKTTNKIILELYDKVKKKGFVVNQDRKGIWQHDKTFLSKLNGVKSALINLGYSNISVRSVIENSKLPSDIKEKTEEELVKYFLSKIV